MVTRPQVAIQRYIENGVILSSSCWYWRRSFVYCVERGVKGVSAGGSEEDIMVCGVEDEREKVGEQGVATRRLRRYWHYMDAQLLLLLPHRERLDTPSCTCF
jgi:hypothetical protein